MASLHLESLLGLDGLAHRINTGRLAYAIFFQDYHPFFLKLLLDKDKININRLDMDSRNLLHHLVKIAESLSINNLLGYLNILLKYKINLTCLDSYGYSPVHLACIFISTQNKIRKYLIPILWNHIKNLPNTLELWQHKSSFGASLIHLLSGDEIRVSPGFYNNFSNIKWISRTGLSLDITDGIGRTPLICAVLNANIKTSLSLVKSGASLDIAPPGRSNYLPLSIINRRSGYYQRIGCTMGVERMQNLKRDLLFEAQNYKVKAIRWEQESIAKLQNKIIQIPVCVLKDMCEFLSDRDRSVVSQVCK